MFGSVSPNPPSRGSGPFLNSPAGAIDAGAENSLLDASLNDYFVELSRESDGLWRWEIKRRSQPLGVKLYEGRFRTPAEAQLAGENFLKQFLDSVARQSDG